MIWDTSWPTHPVREFLRRGGDSFNSAQFDAWLETWDGSEQVGTSLAYSMASAAELREMARLSNENNY